MITQEELNDTLVELFGPNITFGHLTVDDIMLAMMDQDKEQDDDME